ncbi:MAG: exosome complex RNA-binding protein Csl4 [Candidatus Nitrosocaldaceae archaeon]
MSKELYVYPGDRLATIEEFEGKEGTYEDDGIVRASITGKAIYDIKSRTITVIPFSTNVNMPKHGDIVKGLITMATPTMIEMRILYINNNKEEVNLSAIYYSKTKKDTQFRVGDLVRASVTNILNSFIHVTFRNKRLGVIYTRCHLCHGKMVRIDNALKCTECNTRDERKLAEDYGSIENILPIYSVVT